MYEFNYFLSGFKYKDIVLKEWQEWQLNYLQPTEKSYWQAWSSPLSAWLLGLSVPVEPDQKYSRKTSWRKTLARSTNKPTEVISLLEDTPTQVLGTMLTNYPIKIGVPWIMDKELIWTLLNGSPVHYSSFSWLDFIVLALLPSLELSWLLPGWSMLLGTCLEGLMEGGSELSWTILLF